MQKSLFPLFLGLLLSAFLIPDHAHPQVGTSGPTSQPTRRAPPAHTSKPAATTRPATSAKPPARSTYSPAATKTLPSATKSPSYIKPSPVATKPQTSSKPSPSSLKSPVATKPTAPAATTGKGPAGLAKPPLTTGPAAQPSKLPATTQASKPTAPAGLPPSIKPQAAGSGGSLPQASKPTAPAGLPPSVKPQAASPQAANPAGPPAPASQSALPDAAGTASPQAAKRSEKAATPAYLDKGAPPSASPKAAKARAHDPGCNCPECTGASPGGVAGAPAPSASSPSKPPLTDDEAAANLIKFGAEGYGEYKVKDTGQQLLQGLQNLMQSRPQPPAPPAPDPQKIDALNRLTADYLNQKAQITEAKLRHWQQYDNRWNDYDKSTEPQRLNWEKEHAAFDGQMQQLESDYNAKKAALASQ